MYKFTVHLYAGTPKVLPELPEETIRFVYDPFDGCDLGKVPKMLSDSLYRNIVYGVNFTRNGKEIEISGSTVSRTLAMNTLIQKLQVHQEYLDEISGNIEVILVNMRFMNTYLLKQLMNNIKAEFHFDGFNEFINNELTKIIVNREHDYYVYLLKKESKVKSVVTINTFDLPEVETSEPEVVEVTPTTEEVVEEPPVEIPAEEEPTPKKRGRKKKEVTEE